MSWYDNKILEFGQTCPDIDKSINDFKQDIKNHKGDLYELFESYFEKVRQTNSDLRDSAEKQLKDLTDELAEAKETIRIFENKLWELENQ